MKETETIFNFTQYKKLRFSEAIGSNETPTRIGKYQHEISEVSKFIGSIAEFLQV